MPSLFPRPLGGGRPSDSGPQSVFLSVSGPMILSQLDARGGGGGEVGTLSSVPPPGGGGRRPSTLSLTLPPVPVTNGPGPDGAGGPLEAKCPGTPLSLTVKNTIAFR